MTNLCMDTTVLVVDDIETNRILARIYLEKMGWSVLEANSGSEAIEVLCRLRPSHVLLDVKMPGIDGEDVANFVRNTLGDRAIKIVAYTAHALDKEIARLFTRGFDSVLVKPIVYADISTEFGPANVQLF